MSERAFTDPHTTPPRLACLPVLQTTADPVHLFGDLFRTYVRVKKFATCYTLGNLLSIGCTCFLMGPWKQIKNMFKGHRLAATVVYLCSIGFTLYAALKLNNLALTLIFLLVQVGPHARAHAEGRIADVESNLLLLLHPDLRSCVVLHDVRALWAEDAQVLRGEVYRGLWG